MLWQQQNESGLPVNSPTENGYLRASTENEYHIPIEVVTTPVDDGLPPDFHYYSAYDDERNFFALCRGEKVFVSDFYPFLIILGNSVSFFRRSTYVKSAFVLTNVG